MSEDFVIYLLLSGLLAGILGGMGLGGGTLLIPMLTIWLNLPIKITSWLNLVSFIPMAIIAVIIHSKNKLVNWRQTLLILPCALGASIGGVFLALSVQNKIISKVFGGFLVALGIVSIFLYIRKESKQKIK